MFKRYELMKPNQCPLLPLVSTATFAIRAARRRYPYRRTTQIDIWRVGLMEKRFASQLGGSLSTAFLRERAGLLFAKERPEQLNVLPSDEP